MTHHRPSVDPRRILIVACLLIIGLAACGASLVRGEAPFVDVASWRIDGNDLTIDLRVRNVNDVSMPVHSVRLDVRLDDAPLARTETAADRVVAANGFEIFTLNMTASPDGVTALMRLQEREIESLPYALEGSVVTDDDERLKFRRDGHVYRVPGRPGQFR